MIEQTQFIAQLFDFSRDDQAMPMDSGFPRENRTYRPIAGSSFLEKKKRVDRIKNIVYSFCFS